jgi:2-polyprenyl-6-methoxyphenol hydroxylase-like FAD-dependent oxidoreductase
MVSKVGKGSYSSWGSSKALVSMRQGDGSYRVYLGLNVAEDFVRGGTVDLSNTEATRDLFLSADFYADWSEEHKDFIRHSVDFRSWPLYYLPHESLNWKSVPGLTIVGDAAHATTPFAGDGVNFAMVDAIELSSRISEYGIDNGLDRAVQEYEQDMFRRGIDLITRSARNGEVFFAEDSPQTFLKALQDGSFNS